jgi:uncharacterized NTF2-like protein DUF6841
VPCIYIRPARVTVFADAAAARAGLSAGMKQLHADGYDHTEFVGLASRVLSPDLVAFSGTFVRIGCEGRELSRAGFTYTLQLRERGWKLVCAIIHDPPA